MNPIIDCLKTRRSIRGYQKDKMPHQTLIDSIIEAGTYAPTGRNRQSPIIIEVTEEKTRNFLSQLNAKILGADFDPFYGAPVILIVLADSAIPTYLYDGTLVMGNLLNAAHAVGLGSCWIHRAKEIFELQEGRDLLVKCGITGKYEGIGFCAIGYPLSEPSTVQPRKKEYVYRIKADQ